MANTTIALKKSSVPSSVPSDLANGEIALNYADGKLYYKNTAGYIVELKTADLGNYFGTVNANGTLVVADTTSDVFSLVAGDNVTIVGDAINDVITISASVPGGGDPSYAFNQANTARDSANAAYDQANAAYDAANNAVTDFSPAFNQANAAYDKANTANQTADLAYDKANAANLLAFNSAAGANAWANTVAGYANGYAQTVGTAGNNYSITVGAASNGWSNSIFGYANNKFLSNTLLPDYAYTGNLYLAQDLTIANNISNVTSVIFNTGTNRTPIHPGELTWSQDDSTLHFDMDSPSNVIGHIGQDLFFYVKNQTGSSIPKGTVVRFAGTVGASGRLLIAPAIANNSYPSKYTMGVTAAAIVDGADGFVISQGKIRGLNMSAFSEGDILYLSATTPGAFSNVQPTAPNNKITVAAVVNNDNIVGTIEVRITLGSKINENELVELSGLANGDVLEYISANGTFENKQTLVTVNNRVTTSSAASNNWANTVAGYANGYAETVAQAANSGTGAGANAYAVTVGAAANAGTGAGANAYARAVGTAGNTYADTAAAGANGYAVATFVKLTAPNQTITGNLAITGALTVSGNAFTIDTTTLNVTDPLIYLAGNNYVSDTVDIGFVANYVNATSVNTHTGFFRDATIKEYYLFHEYNKEPEPNHIDTAGNNFTLAVLNADIRTSNLTLGGSNTILAIAAGNTYAREVGAGANSGTGIAANLYATTITNANLILAYGKSNTVFDTANNKFLANANVGFANNFAYTGNIYFQTGNVLVARTADSDVGKSVKVDVAGAVNASAFLVNGTALSSGASVNVGYNPPPSGNTAGSLWWNSNVGRLLIYYTDADSSAWVDASPQGPQGPQGATGATGAAATIAVGTTTTLSPATPATVTNSGTASVAVFDFGIPRGNTTTVGSTTTLAPGSAAVVQNGGTAADIILNFSIPMGNVGPVGPKAISIPVPQTGDEYMMFFTDKALTVANVITLTTSQTVSWANSYVRANLYYAADRTSVATPVFTMTTTGNTKVANSITTYTNATIAANTLVWVKLDSVVNSPSEFHMTLLFTA